MLLFLAELLIILTLLFQLTGLHQLLMVDPLILMTVINQLSNWMMLHRRIFRSIGTSGFLLDISGTRMTE